VAHRVDAAINERLEIAVSPVNLCRDDPVLQRKHVRRLADFYRRSGAGLFRGGGPAGGRQRCEDEHGREQIEAQPE
jgi:hypothetical protein